MYPINLLDLGNVLLSYIIEKPRNYERNTLAYSSDLHYCMGFGIFWHCSRNWNKQPNTYTFSNSNYCCFI